MTEYMQSVTKDYLAAMQAAEKLLKENEHDMWQNEPRVCGLYDLSINLREALQKVHEEMYQAMAENSIE